MKNNYSLTPRTLLDSIKKELKSYQSIFYFDIFLMLALLVGLFYIFSGKDNTVADELLLYIVPTETVSSTIINLESNPKCATRDRHGYKHACYNVTIEATIDGKTINKVFKVVDYYKVGHFLNGERNPLIKYAKHNHSIIALANHHSSNFPICIGMLIFLAILIYYVISLSKSKKH